MKKNQIKFTDLNHLNTHLNDIKCAFTVAESFETVFIFGEELYLDVVTDDTCFYINEDRDKGVYIELKDGVYYAASPSIS